MPAADEFQGFAYLHDASSRFLGGAQHVKVRALSDAEVKTMLESALRARSPQHAVLAVGARHLQQAASRGDVMAAKDAYKLLLPYLTPPVVPAARREKTQARLLPMLEENFAANLGVQPPHGLSVSITRALRDVRLVAWEKMIPGGDPSSGHWRLGLGLYCADAGAAAIARMMLGAVRVCLHCQKLFIPALGKVKQAQCCNLYCAAAHRSARWRFRKAQAQKKRAKRGKRGTK